MALTRFKRTLPWARLIVRSLTHTLHLPPAHAEIYNGPHADWLREVLDRLPNLQSLIVRGLPFFDHSALIALKYTQNDDRNRVDSRSSTFGLRLVDASRCNNVTAIGLCHALTRFDSILYLDLSWTYPARDHEVLWSLRHFLGLQVLKLRGIQLRDEDVNVLAQAIGTKVRSLDVRNNQLTDRSVRTLLDHCFTPPPANGGNSPPNRGDRSPSLVHYLGAEMLATYRGEHFESYLRGAFTSSFVSRLAIEDAPEGGITHLYIADNQLSVEGLSGLLRSGRLHVLDAGIVKPGSIRHPALISEEGPNSMPFPGVEKLTPVLAEAARQTLTFLRIDHSLITQEVSNINQEEIVPGRVELPDSSIQMPMHAFELSNDNQIYELPAQVSPIYELPADPIHVIVTQAFGEAPKETEHEKEEMAKARRGSAVAPEVVPESFPEAVDSPRELISPLAETTFADSPVSPVFSTMGRPRTYSALVSGRETRVKAHIAKSKGFHPGVLPCLRTLVLVDVPPQSSTPKAADRLTAFIHDCAEETALARLQARLDYTMPPSNKRQSKYSNTIKDEARKVFALEQVVMEIARAQSTRRKSLASAWRHQSTRSMTQDHDSEALWSASETDFSFFSEGEECGLPSREPGRNNRPLQAMSGMEVATSEPQRHSPEPEEQAPAPQIDVVAKVAQFRKARKAAYDARVASGESDPDVGGYWDGNIKVVRPSQTTNPMFEDDEVWADCYGNRFSNGYLYR